MTWGEFIRAVEAIAKGECEHLFGFRDGQDQYGNFRICVICRTLRRREPIAEKRTDHPFTKHHTYTGPGCAICGRPEEEHETWRG